jgi:SAM-dependent methyltransferase
MERKEAPDAAIPALAVRQVEESERAFFAGYYAERRYNAVGWRLRLERDARVLCAASPGGRLGRVLSVGCGDGAFELMLAARADSVLGVDISPEAVEMARSAQVASGVRNVEFRCLSVVDLGLTERFDTVVCVAFLHHLPAAALSYFLGTAHERLRPGGLFYSQDPSVHGFLRFVGRRVLGGDYDKYHSRDERELDPGEVTGALAGAGFTAIKVQFIDVSLIPGVYFFPRGPDVILHLCALFDRLWCATPLARWASGFSVVARRSGAARRE